MACSGSSPNWTAASPAGLDVVACLPSTCSYGATNGSNASFVSGDTVNVPAGSATYSSKLTISGVKVKLVGATSCATGCSAGSGTGGTYNDNSGTCSSVGTCLTLTNTSSSSFQATASATNFVDISGFTFLAQGNVAVTTGNINLGCSVRGTAPAFRFHHNHVIMPAGTPDYPAILNANCYGALMDHLLIEDKNTTGQAAIPINFFGWFNDQGYTAWNEATQLGSNNAFYLEDYTYTTTQQNTEGLFDAYQGAKVVVRHGSVTGNELGGGHGTDSGGYRSMAILEVYNNTFSNSGSSMELGESRGGITMKFNNTISGNYGAFNLHYFRNAPVNTGQGPEFGTFGVAATGLNWQITSGTPTAANTLGPAPAWAATTSYAANASITIPATCNLWTSAGGTSGGTIPTCPGTGGTVIDGSVTWTNVGGSTASALSVHGWCVQNPDTIATADSTCNALSTGDTASRYFDTVGGTCPFRDQPGVGHNQVVMPNYEWLDTSGHSFGNANSAACVTANSAYYNYTTSFTGATGTGSGLLSARPATCTPLTGYWATDTSTLYQCATTNTWTAYYQPYPYPHPLQGAVTSQPPANFRVIWL